jgi:hypothetical protein
LLPVSMLSAFRVLKIRLKLLLTEVSAQPGICTPNKNARKYG